MRKLFTLKHWLVLVAVVLMLGAVAVAFAQEATPAGETAAAATTEGAAATTEAAPAEGGGGIEALGLNAGYLLAQIVNFGIIFLALRAMLWGPIINMLDSRTAQIEKGLEDAAVAANARKNAEIEAEKITAAAKSDIGKEIESGRVRGEDVAKQIIAQANVEAEKIRAEARASATSDAEKQLAGMRGSVTNISVAIAQRLIGESLDKKKQEALIAEFFTKVPAAAKSLSGNVEVVSAMPLDAAEQDKVKKEIGASNVSFVVDPSILGGLVLRAGDQVVDGSVRSNLTALAGKLG